MRLSLLIIKVNNRNIHQTILKELDLENNSAHVLDLGCGPGTWLMVIITTKTVTWPNSKTLGCCN